MTLAIAWLATRSDGREDLYFSSDSRTRGARVFDFSPKILTLPRSDCAICFAGDTAATYPLMIQLSSAIAAHQPARERNMDIGELKGHLLRVFSDMMSRVRDESIPLNSTDPQFLFGGYSWRAKEFRLWTVYYDIASKTFRAREALAFHKRLRKAAFIGDYAKKYRALLTRSLNQGPGHRMAEFEPLQILAETLKSVSLKDSIGGAPQVVRVGPHMNLRQFCVLWGDDNRPHLFGRPLFDYENCDFWSIAPDSGSIHPPRHFHLERKPTSM